MTVGERIRKIREEQGMTQDELAKKVGYKSRSSVNKIELSRELPLKKVEKVATALGVDPTHLMGWDEEIDVTYKISKEEYEILRNYRSCDDEMKETVKRLLAYKRQIEGKL